MNYKNKVFIALSLVFSSPSLCSQSNKCTADYIVIGVGNAGAVVAEKLSADKTTSVIALQDGPNLIDNPLIKFSKNAIFTVLAALLDTPLYLSGVTTKQQAADLRELLWVLALPSGGASSINAGAYSRQTNDINLAWQAVGGKEWSLKRITKLYKELETYHGQTPNTEFRGFHGPVDVRQVKAWQVSTVSQKFTQAIMQATGLPFVLDYNDPLTPIGASAQLQYTQSGRDGKFRVSSATAFLNDNVITHDGRGVDGRKLRVLFETTALRTLWKNNRAIGVEILKNGKRGKVFANKGVIVCAGLKSSTFLLHSGVGSKQLLKSLNIPVIVDNPNVGQGLADQYIVPLLFSTNPKDTPFPSSDPNSIFSQIAMLPDPTGDQTKRALRFTSVNVFPGFAFVMFDLVNAKSRGSVTINSADPLAKPIIDFGVLTNQEDLELLKRGMQIYVRTINNALQATDPKYGLIFPDPAILDDDAAVTDYIRSLILSAQCYQSHCRMAPLAQGGVVDNRGRVHKTKNLFVADNSIVPVPMNGTTMATGYLIGANVSLLILEDQKK
jgi:choline dehydrogenase-like flavoprotein